MTYLSYSLRQLRKSPGFACIAILTLAVGIGACAAMFSIVRAVVFKPLPFREPHRLVWIENISSGLSGRTSRADVFSGWRDQSKSFETLAAYFAFFDYGRRTLGGTANPERLRSVGISDNFLPTLGVRLLHGRNFTPDECRWNAPDAVILTHSFWRQRFASDPAIVGAKIILDDKPATVVGVLPSDFDFDAIFSPGTEVHLLNPFPLTPETARWGNTVFGIGRLKEGITPEEAQAELTVICRRLADTVPQAGNFGAIVRSIDDALRGRFRTPFFILAGAVLCVLLISCVNLSNLLLSRNNARQREFAVRIAIGARRRDLISQTLTESLTLAVLGAALGLPLAFWAVTAVSQLETFGVPLLHNASIDALSISVTLGLTTFAGVLCGTLPALHVSARRQSQIVQNASHQRSSGRSANMTRNVLVVAEISLACVLLVAAGLLLRSFQSVLQQNLGFMPEHAISWRVDSSKNFKSLAEANGYFSNLTTKIAQLPGIEAVGLSDTLPLGRNRTWGAGLVGTEYSPGSYPVAYPRLVDSGYLQSMKIPLVSGRLFRPGDDASAEKVVVINETFARALNPAADVIGKQIRVNGGSTIIGVVGNVRHASLEETGGNEMYLSMAQSGDWSAMEMVIRTKRPLDTIVPEIRAAIADYDPSLPTGEYYPLTQLVENAVAPRKLITQLLSFFSGLAVSLAALGLYGVIAYSVSQRTQEIGIRMAIGAQRSDILAMIMKGGLRLVLVGLALGLFGAFAVTQLLENLLFGVSAQDPLTFGANALILIGVSASACLIPAYRATLVAPLIALRAE